MDKELYQQARAKAREIREKYSLVGPRVMVNDLKRIYRAEGIVKIDYYDGFKSTRFKGAYFNDDVGSTVMINKKLIKQIDPKVFTLAHELKHHLMDEVHEVSLCVDNNEHVIIERTADAFASELLYPGLLFSQDLKKLGVEKGTCTPEHIVHLKHGTGTTLSHAALAIKATNLGYAEPGSLSKIKWYTLRDTLYPEYQAFRNYRRAYV